MKLIELFNKIMILLLIITLKFLQLQMIVRKIRLKLKLILSQKLLPEMLKKRIETLKMKYLHYHYPLM